MDRESLRPPLDARALRDGLIGTDLFWRRLDVVAQTGSTNADLLARAASGADIDGAVLIAEHQTTGRGRHGRQWSAAPRAQITMSVGVSAVDVPAAAWGWLPLATGVAVVDAVVPLLEGTGVEAGLKWPNDVLAGGGKLAGILAEVAAPFVVVGVGLNVTLGSDEIDGTGATSLLDLLCDDRKRGEAGRSGSSLIPGVSDDRKRGEAGRSGSSLIPEVTAPDRDRLVRRLLHELGTRIGQWRSADPSLLADYRARSLTIGSRVRVRLPGDREVVGTARGIDDQGRLCVETSGHDFRETVALSAGDVVHLR